MTNISPVSIPAKNLAAPTLSAKQSLPAYVVITPARNEEEFVSSTIESVIAQTVRPLKWVIVSDGSTDRTVEIVTQYAAQHPWIELIQMHESDQRNFASKVHAFNAGYDRVKDLAYDVIVSLDADVTFEADYFEFLLHKFLENPNLGLIGTPFREGSFQYDYRFTNIEHVSGPCQVFDRKCFEDIGGYLPREIGGIDLIAVLSARMKGWETRTFTEKWYRHHRKMGSAAVHALLVPLRVGRKDYVLGSHPIWQVSRCLYQATRRPLLIGGIMQFLGYFWALATGAKKQVGPEIIRFRRDEELERLRSFLNKIFFGIWPISNLSASRCIPQISRAIHLFSVHAMACILSVVTLLGFWVHHHSHASAKSRPAPKPVVAHHSEPPLHQFHQPLHHSETTLKR